MPDASQQRSDQRLAVGEKKEQPQERPPFSVTDDLREPIDELTRLKDMEAKTREIIQKYQAAMREMECASRSSIQGPQPQEAPQPHPPRGIAHQEAGEHLREAGPLR